MQLWHVTFATVVPLTVESISGGDLCVAKGPCDCDLPDRRDGPLEKAYCQGQLSTSPLLQPRNKSPIPPLYL
jgi:hypothetical protein